MKWLLEAYPLINKPWFSLIRVWHYRWYSIHPRFPMVPPLFTGGCYQPPITRPSTSGQILGEGRRAWPRLDGLDGLLGLGGFRVPEAVARLFCTCCAMERLRGCASRCHCLDALTQPKWYPYPKLVSYGFIGCLSFEGTIVRWKLPSGKLT